MAAPNLACAATSPPTTPTTASKPGASTRRRTPTSSPTAPPPTRCSPKRPTPPGATRASGPKPAAAARRGTPWPTIPTSTSSMSASATARPGTSACATRTRKDNLFLSSILALKPDTGEYVWHYQTTPGETWDYTATQHIILADLKIGDKVRKVLMQAPKNGFFYVLDRATGELISADKYQDNVNWATERRPDDRPSRRRPRRALSRQPLPGDPRSARQPQLAPDGVQPGHRPRLHPRPDTSRALCRPGRTSAIAPASGTPAPNSPALRARRPTLNERLAARAALKGQLVAWDPVAKKARWVDRLPNAVEWRRPRHRRRPRLPGRARRQVPRLSTPRRRRAAVGNRRRSIR